MCQPMHANSIHVGIYILRRVDPRLDKTGPVALRICSCPIFNKQDPNVKLKASKLQADRRKLIVSLLMNSVGIAALCLRQWVAFTTFVLVKRYAHPSLKKISNVAVRGKNSMHWDDTIYRRKTLINLKCRTKNGGNCTKQPILLSNISQNTFLTSVHLQLSNY